MAKIRINGDTSGYIEISAPAVAGSTSITLPATTGGSLLATDANGNLNVDSGVLYVDGVNNRVGIGTTSPGAPLEVNGGDGLLVKGSSTDSFIQSYATANNYLEFKDAGGAAGSILYNHTSDYLSFKVNGSERTRIDSSGRLLVGTSSARGIGKGWIYDGDPAQFEIESTSTSDISLITNRNDFIAGHLRFGKSRGGIGSNTIVANNDSLGNIQFCGADGTDIYSIAAEISAQVDGTPGNNDMPGRLVFSTTADGASSPTERMRIKSNGHLQVTTDGGFGGLDGVSHGFRTTTANWVAQFMNDQITGTNNFGVQIKYVSSAPNGTGNSFLLCGDSAADRVQLRSNGGLANYQANNVNLSDRNAKKDIVPATGTWDCIKEWEIVNYRYKDQPDDADLNLGVIAQQVAESCPEVITVFQEATEDEPEKLGIKEQQMYWMAIKALQEAQLRIEQLEATNASFEARLSALEVKP